MANMNRSHEDPDPLAESASPPGAGEIDLLRHFEAIVDRRWFIIGCVFVTALVAAGISLLIPLRFTATTTILPTEDSGGGSGLGALLADNPIASFAMGGMGGSSTELFVELLSTRTVLDGVIDDLNLMALWEMDKKQIARARLSGLVQVSASDGGIISLSAEAGTPELAARIANTMIEHLDKINREKNITKATNTRRFIERRLVQSKRDLHEAEENMLAFQNRYGTIAIEEQTRAVIEAAALLKAELTTRTIERNVLRKSIDSSHPKIKDLQAEIDELENQLQEMDQGDWTQGALSDSTSVFARGRDGTGNLYPPISAIPSLAVETFRHYRDVKVQNAIFELVTQQYETAKIQEARDTPTLHVLDEAVPPELKSWPLRAYIVIACAMLAFVFSLFFIFAVAQFRQLTEREEKHDQVQRIIGRLKQDFSRLKIWSR
jgi:tyrosine-protein kinase Etk/Wzc